MHLPRQTRHEDGGTAEWQSRTLPRYARMTRQVEALIAGTYLAGTNTRRVRRALAALFKGAIGKEAVTQFNVVKGLWADVLLKIS